MFPYVLTTDAVTVVVDGKAHVVYKSNQYYGALITAIKNKDKTGILNNVSLAEQINKFGKGKVTVRDGVVYYNSAPVNNAVSEHIIKMVKEGFNVDPMLAFLRNLMNNPSETSRNELYLFMQKGKMPITPDGHFLAYKRVRNDYTDVHSGKFDNSPGKTVEMKREDVDTNRHNTCSRGLHFCSEGYLPHFSPGSKVVLVKVNPADVVSIPSDYANAKGRTWRYVVLQDVTDKVGTFTTAVYQDETEDSDNDPVVDNSASATDRAKFHNVRDKHGKFVKATSKRRVN